MMVDWQLKGPPLDGRQLQKRVSDSIEQSLDVISEWMNRCCCYCGQMVDHGLKLQLHPILH